LANNTEKKIVKGLFWGFLTFMLTFLKQILIVPFILHYWGNYKYSLWILLFSTYSVFITFNAGHSQYIKNFINQEYHIDKKNAAFVLSSSLYISFFVFFIQLIFSFILLNDNILSNILHVDLADIIKYNLTLSLFFLIISYSMLQSIFRLFGTLYCASGNIYIQLRFEVIYSILEITILLICIILGFSIFSLTIVLFSFIIIFLLIYLYILKIKFPDFYPWWKNGNIKTGFNNFKKSLVFTTNSIFEQFNLYGINLLISNIIGNILVPAFTTIRTIANTLSYGTNIILNTVLPDIQKFHAKKEGDKLISTFTLNWFITGAMVNIGLIAILPFIEAIYLLWTKHKIEFNNELFYL